MDGSVFDLKEFWQDILKKSKESDNEVFAEFPDYLEKKYPNEPKLEDFAFYKDYLSKFVLNGELYGKEFLNDSDMSFEECFLLLRFAAASFSSTYELAYLKDEDKLELTFHVTSRDQRMKKTLQELWIVQVYSLFRIYLEEQLHMEFLISERDMEVDIRDERKARLSIFEREMAKCVDALHDTSGGRNGGKSIEDELDELLKS